MEGVFTQKIEDGVETLVEEIEGDPTKSVYSKNFKGDIFGKNDPYGEGKGDHAGHALESSFSDPDADAEWFPAVKKAGSGKDWNKPVLAPGKKEYKQAASDRKLDGTVKQDGSSDGKKDDAVLGNKKAAAGESETNKDPSEAFAKKAAAKGMAADADSGGANSEATAEKAGRDSSSGSNTQSDDLMVSSDDGDEDDVAATKGVQKKDTDAFCSAVGKGKKTFQRLTKEEAAIKQEG